MQLNYSIQISTIIPVYIIIQAVPCYVGDDASVALEASRGLLLTSPSQTDPDVAVDTRIL